MNEKNVFSLSLQLGLKAKNDRSVFSEFAPHESVELGRPQCAAHCGCFAGGGCRRTVDRRLDELERAAAAAAAAAAAPTTLIYHLGILRPSPRPAKQGKPPACATRQCSRCRHCFLSWWDSPWSGRASWWHFHLLCLLFSIPFPVSAYQPSKTNALHFAAFLTRVYHPRDHFRDLLASPLRDLRVSSRTLIRCLPAPVLAYQAQDLGPRGRQSGTTQRRKHLE